MLPVLDPFFMIVVNVIGAIVAAIFSTLIGSVGAEVITPLFESIGQGLGLATAA